MTLFVPTMFLRSSISMRIPEIRLRREGLPIDITAAEQEQHPPPDEFTSQRPEERRSRCRARGFNRELLAMEQEPHRITDFIVTDAAELIDMSSSQLE